MNTRKVRAGMPAPYEDFAERLTQVIDLHTEIQNGRQLAQSLTNNMQKPVTPQAVSMWLRGNSIPTEDNLKAIACLLGTTPEYLLGSHAYPRPGRKRKAEVKSPENAKKMAVNDIIRNARKMVVNDIINLMEVMHESAKDRHNHWLVAAQLLRVEFGSGT